MTTVELTDDKDNQRFIMPVGEHIATVTYTIKNNIMYLIHSEVPHQLRGQGIGKILVEKTFEYLVANKIKAVAVCTYIKRIKQRSEKWNDLIG